MIMFKKTGKLFFKIDALRKGMSISYPSVKDGNRRNLKKNNSFSVTSPDGKIEVIFFSEDRLFYSVNMNGYTVIEKSALGVVSKNIDFGENVIIGNPQRNTCDCEYEIHGKHSHARDIHCSYIFPVLNTETGIEYKIEFRLWNDGIGYRYIFEEDIKLLISEEKSEFNLPVDSVCYYQTDTRKLQGKSSVTESRYMMNGLVVSCLATFELSNGGYVMLTESNLKNYPGCGLLSKGCGKFQVYFWDSGKFFTNGCVSPWRIAVICPDLNSFTNNDVVTNSADSMLPIFKNASWIKCGKASWSYYIDEEKSRDFETIMAYNEYVEQTKLTDYSIIDSTWRWWNITEWGAFRKVRKVVKDGENRGGIGIWIWKAIPAGPYFSFYRKWFFKQCVKAGVKGIKLDHIESESQFQINLYRKFLEEAAENNLMVVFHNPQKPTGLERTYPNLLTMEAVRGLQCGVDPDDTTIIAFTRLTVSGADYTPVCFNNPDMSKSATWTHQIASAVVLYSPLMTFADNPKMLAQTETYEFLKELPSIWDESVCLKVSKIGDVAAFARKKGENWYVGILNSLKGERDITVDFDFLSEGVSYMGEAFLDDKTERCNTVHKRIKAVKTNRIRIHLSNGGGFACVLKAQDR